MIGVSYHSLDAEFQHQLQQALSLRDGVDDLVDAFNENFAFLVLANFATITLVTITLLPAIIKVDYQSYLEYTKREI